MRYEAAGLARKAKTAAISSVVPFRPIGTSGRLASSPQDRVNHWVGALVSLDDSRRNGVHGDSACTDFDREA